MAIEVPSASHKSSVTTYKSKKRAFQDDDSPSPKKRIKVLRDDADRTITKSAGVEKQKSKRKVSQLFPLSPAVQNATTTASSPPLRSKPKLLEQNVVAQSSPMKLSKPVTLGSPFRRKQSENLLQADGDIHRDLHAKKRRLVSSRIAPREAPRRAPTLSKTSDTAAQTRRTASGITKSSKPQRDSSWLVPAAHVQAPRAKRAEKAKKKAMAEDDNDDMEGVVPTSCAADKSPDDLPGMTSFFSGVPDAFSTPVRLEPKGPQSKQTFETAVMNAAQRPLNPPAFLSSPFFPTDRRPSDGTGDPFKLATSSRLPGAQAGARVMNTAQPSNMTGQLPDTKPRSGLDSAALSPITNSPSFRADRSATFEELDLMTTKLHALFLPRPSTSTARSATRDTAAAATPLTPADSPTPPKRSVSLSTTATATVPIAPTLPRNPHRLAATSRPNPAVTANESGDEDGDITMRPSPPIIDGALSSLTISDHLSNAPTTTTSSRTAMSSSDGHGRRVASAGALGAPVSVKTGPPSQKAAAAAPRVGRVRVQRKSGRMILQSESESGTDVDLDHRSDNGVVKKEKKKDVATGKSTRPRTVSASSASTVDSANGEGHRAPSIVRARYYSHDDDDDDESEDELLLKKGQTKFLL